MADRTIRIWSSLGAERVHVEMAEYQLAALVSFLRTARDDLYPNWPAHFADELEGKPSPSAVNSRDERTQLLADARLWIEKVIPNEEGTQGMIQRLIDALESSSTVPA